MSPERFRTIDRLHHAALQIDPAMRSEYLRNACHGDGALLQEVESLLALQDEAGRFINLPAIDVVARHSFASSTTPPFRRTVQCGGCRNRRLWPAASKLSVS
jgi:hypothetical protein